VVAAVHAAAFEPPPGACSEAFREPPARPRRQLDAAAIDSGDSPSPHSTSQWPAPRAFTTPVPT
ncbi:MAG: hypothetical protein ACXW31_14935, partial [Thermoanaerobaculia bacterium]